MTPLGKPLVFYLKYMAEMERLYVDLEEAEERHLTGLDDAEQVLEMLRIVGDAAYEHVTDFLVLCGKEMEGHFTGLGIATLAKKTNRAYVKNHWDWAAKFHVSSMPGGSFWCGAWITAPPVAPIALAKDVCGIVVPYLWSESGRKGADAMWKVVGSWADSRGGEGWFSDKGTVALGRIPVKPQPPGGFDVDRDPLIAEVINVIARIGVEETKAIAKFVASLKESEEN